MEAIRSILMVAVLASATAHTATVPPVGFDLACTSTSALGVIKFEPGTTAPASLVARIPGWDPKLRQPTLVELGDGSFASVASSRRGEEPGVYFFSAASGKVRAYPAAGAPALPSRYALLYARGTVTKDGRLFIAFVQMDTETNVKRSGIADSRIKILESKDGGRSWREAKEFVAGTPGATGWGGLWQPSLVADGPRGLVLVATEQRVRAEARCPGGRGTYRDDTVFVATSADGASWSERHRAIVGECATDYNEAVLAHGPQGWFVVAHRAKDGDLVVSRSVDGVRWGQPATFVTGERKADHRVPRVKLAGDALAVWARDFKAEEDDGTSNIISFIVGFDGKVKRRGSHSLPDVAGCKVTK
jgi:hypothetical protein